MGYVHPPLKLLEQRLHLARRDVWWDLAEPSKFLKSKEAGFWRR